MHPDEFQNWKIIKEKLEKNSATENFYYKRACAIVEGKPDPMKNLKNLGHGTQDDTTET